MNAITKGVTLGIFKKNRAKGLEVSPAGAQPYVNLMGRRIPLLQNSADAWRGLDAEAQPASPAAAFSYISRALKQTAPAIVGALRLLAESFPPDELNRAGWSLYADFRPEVDGWGKRGKVRCDKILRLRRAVKHEQADRQAPASVVKYEASANDTEHLHAAFSPDTPTDTKKPPCEDDGDDDDDDDDDAYFVDDFTAEELSALP
jgi:hypothetical protein